MVFFEIWTCELFVWAGLNQHPPDLCLLSSWDCICIVADNKLNDNHDEQKEKQAKMGKESLGERVASVRSGIKESLRKWVGSKPSRSKVRVCLGFSRNNTDVFVSRVGWVKFHEAV
jgi:hypothetical protein